MDPKTLAEELTHVKDRFDRSTACFTEEDSGFAPQEGLMTVAQHVAHVAQTYDWFIEGAFRPEGFDMDFAKLGEELAKVTSLAAAREWLDRSTASAVEAIGGKTAEELATPLPEGPIMGGAPRAVIIEAIGDHTAHHRGALTVYARLCGREPAMPYAM